MRISSIPQIYRHINRWGEIVAVLSKYGLADWIGRLGIGIGRHLFRDRDGSALALHTRETRIRLAIIELGPTFIKFGQILSTRPDLVGMTLASELKLLQSELPADPPEYVRELIESELLLTLEEAYAEFELVPLASASIGQVHRARLHTGEKVVVKIQHQNICERIKADLDIIAGLAGIIEKRPEFAPYRPQATVTEFKRTMLRELDFSREARNMELFNAAFRNDPSVRIPQAYSELTTSRVLTMELLEGIKLSDLRSVDNCANYDPAEVARAGANLYLKMIFTVGSYHADPHPGNILILPDNVIGLLDFGMVGRIDDILRDQVGEMFSALLARDAVQLTNVIMRLGQVPDTLDRGLLAADLADFVSHYGYQRLDQFDLSGALTEMIGMIRRHQIQLPSQIALLLKVLIMLEGTAQLVSPTFNLIEVLKPYQRQMLLQRFSPKRRFRKLQRIFKEIEHLAETLPLQISDLFRQMQSGKFDVHLDHRGLEPSVNRLVLGMLASALFLGSSLLLSRNVPPRFNLPPILVDTSVLGLTGCAVSVAIGLRLLRAINKSGHLDRQK